MNYRVSAVVDDLFFAAKIRGTAESLGIKVDFMRDTEFLFQIHGEEQPSVIIIDLHAQRCDPFDLAQRLKADDKTRSIPVIGFYSHVQTELQSRAQQSGFDHVLARSAFTKRLPEILRGIY